MKDGSPGAPNSESSEKSEAMGPHLSLTLVKRKRGTPRHPKLSCDFGTQGEEGGPAGAPSRTFGVNGRDCAARLSTPDRDPRRPPHSLAGQSPGRSHRSPGVRAGSSGNGSRGGGGGCCVLVPVGK